MVENGKSVSDIYLKVCENISVKPENAIICEEAPNGIIAAYRSGAKPIMIIDRIEPTDEIKDLLFVKPLDSLTQVQEIISNGQKNVIGEKMDFLELVEERYSCRSFSTKEVEKEKIEKILKVAKLAPTARNLQPQRVLVLTQKEQLEKLNGCTQYGWNAPVIMILFYDKSISY